MRDFHESFVERIGVDDPEVKMYYTILVSPYRLREVMGGEQQCYELEPQVKRILVKSGKYSEP